MNGSTIPAQGPTPDAKLAAKVYRIDLHRRFVEASRTVEKAKTDRLVTMLPSFHSVCHLQYTNFELQVKNAANKATDGCVMPDVVVPEAHQNDRSYVRELSGPTLDLLRKNLAWWVVTWRTSKNHKTVKIGGWALAQGWALAWDKYGTCIFLKRTFHKEYCMTHQQTQCKLSVIQIF